MIYGRSCTPCLGRVTAEPLRENDIGHVIQRVKPYHIMYLPKNSPLLQDTTSVVYTMLPFH